MNMKKLVILGAGGFGREVHAWLLDIMKTREDLSIVGFLDDNADRFRGLSDMPPVVGSFRSYSLSPDEFLVCAVGDPTVKIKAWHHWKAQGANFFTLIHPTALIQKDVEIGEGCVICPMASVASGSKLDFLVALNVLARVDEGVRIGAASTLSGHVFVGRNARLGEGAFLSSQAVVEENVCVGVRSKIGAGSVARTNVAEGATVFGVPARQIAGFN